MTEMDDAMAERSRQVGQAIQRTVAADPELASSIVGIGLDQLSSVMIHSPQHLPSFGGWVRLISSIYAYVMEAEPSDTVDALLAGELGISNG